MNDLSWMLYLADVLPSLGTGAGLAGGVSLAATITVWLFGAVYRSTSRVAPASELSKREHASSVALFNAGRKLIPLVCVLAMVNVLSPSQRTIYLIMGSELGEEVIQSETGKRVLDAVNKKLDEYLNVEVPSEET